MQKKESVDDILKKYGSKIEKSVKSSDVSIKDFSQSYIKFKNEMKGNYSAYEKWCHTLGNIIKIKPSKKDEEEMRKNLTEAHLDVEPWQAIGLGITAFVGVFLIGLFLSLAIALIRGFENFPVFTFFLSIILSLVLFYAATEYPKRVAKKWRLKASSQMVPAILYIVVYMRHTSNLEKAIAFAAEHLDEPLSLDFRKIFYDVEIGKYHTIKDSLDSYLQTWKGHSTEFIEGFHLIESSLFEPNEGRRIQTLEKALQVVLDGVYDKMLKFSHSVKAPLTNVYMLGVMMPTLGLALIPLASAMMGGAITPTGIFILFNLIIPIMVFFLTDKILMLRPGGHGDTSLLEKNPLYYKYKNNAPYWKAFWIVLPLILISLIPFFFGIPGFTETLGLQQDYTFGELGLSFFGESEMFFGYFVEGEALKGPLGSGALFLGMLFPLAIAIFFSKAYSEKTKEMIKERSNTKALEKEFNNSLFQLGNRLGNGIPPELVFAKVAASNKGLKTGKFFSQVNYNIRNLGMSVESAIFDKKRGALRFYPSSLISTSMRVLVESSKKGLNIAAVSLMGISEYVKNLDKITIRLKDLLAEVTSDMKSNMTFLAPLLSGIVVGLASMITSILGKINTTGLEGESVSGALSLFDYTSMLPPYYLQIAVGIYLIEIVFILTSALVSIDAGEDKLQETYKVAQNLRSGIGLYFIVAFVATLALTILAGSVLGGLL